VARIIPGTLARPERVQIDAGRKIATLWGEHGRVFSRGGGYPAKAVVDLETGKVSIERIGRSEGVDRSQSPLARGIHPDASAATLYWDARRSRAALFTLGARDGYRLFAWDLQNLGMVQVPNLMPFPGLWLDPNRLLATRDCSRRSRGAPPSGSRTRPPALRWSR